jgi:DNA-binding response OmpR family regulator
MLTCETASETVKEAFYAGADGYIVKDLEGQAINTKVMSILRRRHPRLYRQREG